MIKDAKVYFEDEKFIVYSLNDPAISGRSKRETALGDSYYPSEFMPIIRKIEKETGADFVSTAGPNLIFNKLRTL